MPVQKKDKKKKSKRSKRKNKSSSSGSEVLAAEITSLLTPVLDPLAAQVNSLSGDLQNLKTSVLQPQVMQVQPQPVLNPGAAVFQNAQAGGNRFVPPIYYNQANVNVPVGRGRGQGQPKSPAVGAAAGNVNQRAKFRCPKCVEDDAVFCNHCKTCWKIDHRTVHCPHRDDPNFVPSKNC